MFHDQFMRPAEGAEVLERGLAGANGADPLLTAEVATFWAVLARDREAFHRKLADLLYRHREACRAADVRPATLLPLGPLSLACLADDDLGWDIDVESDYLPQSLLNRGWVTRP